MPIAAAAAAELSPGPPPRRVTARLRCGTLRRLLTIIVASAASASRCRGTGSGVPARAHDRGRRDAEGAAARRSSGARCSRRVTPATCTRIERSRQRRRRADRAGGPGVADPLAVPARRERPRGRRCRAREIAALAPVPGVAEVWPNVRYHSLAVAARPAADRRRQALGAELRDGRQRDEDRDHRRRRRRRASVLQPERLPVSARVPEGTDAVHDAEGDRAADVHAAVADVEVRGDAVRSRRSRSTRRTSPGIAAGDHGADGRRDRRSPASHRTRTSATTRRSRSRLPASGSTETAPRSPRRSKRPSPTA